MISQLYSMGSIYVLILQVLQVLLGHLVPQVLLALKVNIKIDRESLTD